MTAAHVATALALTLAPWAAQAARPLATDDAGVLGRGECEWEFGADRPGGDGHGWSTLGTCGVIDGLQALASYGQARAAGATRHSLSLGAKKSLVDGGTNGTAWTASAALNALRDDGASWRGDSLALNLVASRPLGAGFTGHANLGWQRSRATGQAATTWNLALERSGAAGIDLTGEVFGDDRSRAPWLAAGVRWNATPAFSLNAAWARQGGAVPARLFTVGCKLGF